MGKLVPVEVQATCIPPSFIINQVDEAPVQNNLVLSGAYKIVVSWLPKGGVDSYEINRDVNGAGFTMLTSVAAPTLNFVDLDIEPSNTYSYVIFTLSGGQASCLSNIQVATTPGPVVDFFFGENKDLSGYINTGWSQCDDFLWPFPRIVDVIEPFRDEQTADGYISSSITEPAPGSPYNVNFQSRLSSEPVSHSSFDPADNTMGGWEIEKPIIRQNVAFPPGVAGGESRDVFVDEKKLFSFLFSDGGETGVADAVIAFGIDVIDVESYEFGNRAIFRIYSGKTAPFSEVEQFELDYMDVLDGSDEIRFVGVRANFAFKLATISVGSPADNPPTPVILNPGWEDWTGGEPDGWTSGSNLSLNENTASPIDGDSSLVLENIVNSLGLSDSGGFHYQDVGLLRSTKYNVQVKIRKSTSIEATIFIASISGFLYLEHTTLETSVMELDFDIVAFDTTIAFVPLEMNMFWVIDTLIITEIPPTVFPGLGWGSVRTVEQA